MQNIYGMWKIYISIKINQSVMKLSVINIWLVFFFHRYKETSDENRSWRYMELRCKNRSGNHILENWSAFTAALDLRFFKPQIEAVFILDRITSKMGRIITLWRTDPHSLGELSILILWKIYSMPSSSLFSILC